MSTQGTGTVALFVAAPIGIGLSVGMLIGKGVMFGIKQEQAHYARMTQMHIDNANTVSQSNLAQRKVMRSLYEIIAQATEEQAEAKDDARQEALHHIIAKTQAALNEARHALTSSQDAEREGLLLQLSLEIEMCHTLLSTSLLLRAERAQDGTLTDIREAIIMLQEARQQQMSKQARQTHQQWQMQHTLRRVKTQLDIINGEITQAGTTLPSDLAERQRAIKALLATAQTLLDSEPEQAQNLVTEAQRVARVFTESVSAFLFEAWEKVRHQVNTQLGMLITLKGMVADAQTLKMAHSTLLDELMQRVDTANQEAEAIGQSSTLRVGERLSRLTKQTAALKEEIFAIVGTYQQRTIAETIATTLQELGFQALDGNVPTAQASGETMHISAMRNLRTDEEPRDDRLVAFTVDHDGTVSYDFSGYSDEACVKEAEDIFAALRRAGIYLLDTQAAEQLQADYPEGISQRALNRLPYHLQPVVNKSQPELAQRIRLVLEQMQYAHIQQSSIGGYIEFDAFNGPLGYHVVLSPEGTMQVFKGIEQMDISTDLTDHFVSEAHHIVTQQEAQEELIAQEEQKSQRRTYRNPHHTWLKES